MDKKEKFELYKAIVLEENKKFNLTAITEDSAFNEKHFYDSLLPTEVVDFNNKKVLDIGSGAGFPGMPLAITYENSNFTLLETTNKKCVFLRNTIEKLELNNVNVLEKRAEDISENERESFDIVVSRAVSDLQILLELSIPYLKIGGILVAYKGEKYNEEISRCTNAFKVLGCRVLDVQERKLPISNERRFNIIIVKDKETNKKFPRNFSQIKKRPL